MLSDSDRAIIKGQIAALGGIKLVATILTLYYFPSWQAVLVVAVLSLPWIIGAFYYFGRVGWLRYRFWSYRHIRARLLHEEWNLDGDASETIAGDRSQRG